MGKPLTDDERARIADAIRKGSPRNQIARDFGRSPGTVSAIAKAHELTFDRSATKHATEARQADNQAKRAELIAGMLDDAAMIRRWFREPATYSGISKTGEVVTYRLDHPTFSDIRNIAVSVKVLTDAALNLEKINGPIGSDGAEVDRWLIAMMGKA